MGGRSLSGEFTAEVSMVIVGARSLRRVEDCPGSSFGRGLDIVGVFIQCAIHAWHPGIVGQCMWIKQSVERMIRAPEIPELLNS